jgi:PadR family transcriptional regulator PadR
VHEIILVHDGWLLMRFSESKSDILQGALDLMVLKTLDAMGPLHGYGIARRIEQLSEETLLVNHGSESPV